jgi:membrane-bound ClpP family serine protease
VLGTVVATVLTLVFALRSKTWRRFKLNASISSTVEGRIEEGQIKPGDSGIAISRLAPMGKARINEMVVEAKSQGDFIDQKSEIVVVKIEDNKVIVKPKN